MDSKAFHRSIAEEIAYVKGGRVPSKNVLPCRHYLTGKALSATYEKCLATHIDDAYIPLLAFHTVGYMYMDYEPDADPIWVGTDACGNRICVGAAQGKNWHSAKVTVFFSAKTSSVLRNYPVHRRELLAGVEMMLRHRNILQGTQFTWLPVIRVWNTYLRRRTVGSTSALDAEVVRVRLHCKVCSPRAERSPRYLVTSVRV